MIGGNSFKRNLTSGDNRLTILGAIIFLFAAGIVLRLFNVQILNYDLYSARAMRQHGVAKEILPLRGRIFVRASEEKSELYPLAANKEFALVYAVPEDIVNPKEAMEKLTPILFPLFYEEPDQDVLVANIEKNLRQQMAADVINRNPPAPGEEIIIDEEQLKIALAKERLILEENLTKAKE